MSLLPNAVLPSLFYLLTLVVVVMPLSPAKSMVPPPRTLPSRYCYICGTLCYSAFLSFFRLLSAPPPSVCRCPRCVGCVVLGPRTGHRTARFSLFFFRCLHPINVLPFAWSSGDVLKLAHQLALMTWTNFA